MGRTKLKVIWDPNIKFHSFRVSDFSTVNIRTFTHACQNHGQLSWNRFKHAQNRNFALKFPNTKISSFQFSIIKTDNMFTCLRLPHNTLN